MRQFVATFHTHLSALMTSRTLEASGYSARMAPVPRVLSSSCGTCVMYEAPDCCEALLDADTEAVYEMKDHTYSIVLSND